MNNSITITLVTGTELFISGERVKYKMTHYYKAHKITSKDNIIIYDDKKIICKLFLSEIVKLEENINIGE